MTQRRDLQQDQDFIEFAEAALHDLVPAMQNTHVVVSVVPKDTADIQYALELGMAVLMDVPIVAVVAPGRPVSSRLARVAERIIEVNVAGPDAMEQLAEQLEVVTRELEAAGIIPRQDECG